MLLFVNLTYIIFYMENNFRSFEILGIPFKVLSGVLFIMLFALVLFTLMVKGAPLSFLDTPLEYLVLFLSISVPLIPQPFQGEHHLLAVTGKSIILFMAYKLILMSHQERQNRMFVMLTFLALSYVVVRVFI